MLSIVFFKIIVFLDIETPSYYQNYNNNEEVLEHNLQDNLKFSKYSVRHSGDKNTKI